MNKLQFPTQVFGLQNRIIIEESSLITANPVGTHYVPILGLGGNAKEQDTPDFTSSLGTAVYGSLKLGSTDPLKDPQNQYTGIDGKVYTFDTVTLPIAVITATLKKRIVKTSIQGRPGKIKEYIALDDYDITINTVFDNPQGIAPKTDIALLQQVALAEMAIPVTSYYLNQLGIYFIVIEEMSYPQEAGRYSSQAITIHACSDYQEKTMLP